MLGVDVSSLCSFKLFPWFIVMTGNFLSYFRHFGVYSRGDLFKSFILAGRFLLPLGYSSNDNLIFRVFAILFWFS
jgi:hypothetical protein